MDKSTTPLTIRRVPLASLHQDPANARQHGDRNLDSIRASLRRFGQAEPLVVHKATGRVIGGNGRLVAMASLGWTECDVVEVEVDDVTAGKTPDGHRASRASWPMLMLFGPSAPGTDAELRILTSRSGPLACPKVWAGWDVPIRGRQAGSERIDAKGRLQSPG